MSLPARDKTWQIAPNLRSHNIGNSSTNDPEPVNGTLMLTIKDTLIGFSSNPWLMESSCDQVNFGNNDQVDWWIDIDDVHGPPWTFTEHSWYVLKDPITGIQFCFDCNVLNFLNRATVVVSPVIGFGAVNGGGDGTVDNRPTATDEIVLINESGWGPTASYYQQSTLHVWRSTDGECTRIVMMRNRVCQGYWDFSAAKDPIAAWSPAVVFTATASTAGRLTYGVMYNANTAWVFHHAAVGNGNFFIGTVGVYNTGALQNEPGGRVQHAAKVGELTTVPPILVSTTTNLRGVWGSMYDWHWGSDAYRTGEIIVDNDLAWVLVDDVWLPWELDLEFFVS